MTKDSGGPAFPVNTHNSANPGACFAHEGMALRDYFAAMAMQGDWAAQSRDINCVFDAKADRQTLEDSATLYYRMADAMLKVRRP